MGSAASRRTFLQGIGIAGLGMAGAAASAAEKKPIAGFEDNVKKTVAENKWQPVSDRKIKFGIVGYGMCQFGAAFSFQHHPNVEIVGVSDLFADRCAGLAKDCKCKTSYPSLEKLIENDNIEAVFVATDAPSHVDHCIKVLKSGKHVASAVPATWKSVEDGEKLLEAVETTGKKYMMFETSMFHASLYAMRKAYMAGAIGRIVYSEGEYYHRDAAKLPGYKNWRFGLPPLWYPTHNTAYYIGVTDKTFTEVSCQGFRGGMPENKPGANQWDNPFDSEVALFKTSEGGMSRQAVAWGFQGGPGGEHGRIFGEFGSMQSAQYSGAKSNLLPASLARPGLPPGVFPGYHGGSHGQLCHEFVTAILENRDPLVDIYMALNMTVPGIIAHQSALKNGELLKVPQYKRPG